MMSLRRESNLATECEIRKADRYFRCGYRLQAQSTAPSSSLSVELAVLTRRANRTLRIREVSRFDSTEHEMSTNGTEENIKPWGSRCWLLTSPQTGSTRLQFLLNHNAGVSLRIGEDRERARYSFGEHLSEKFCHSLHEFLQWDPIVSRVHCHHFGAYLIDRPLLKLQMPPVRFVLLERKDRIAQAVSLAVANHTGITQCNTIKTQNAFQALPINVVDSELLACWKAVGDYVEFWRNWLHSEPHLVVTYESLLEDPRETVAKIFDYLGTPYSDISLSVPLLKLKHSESKNSLNRLRELTSNIENRNLAVDSIETRVAVNAKYKQVK